MLRRTLIAGLLFSIFAVACAENAPMVMLKLDDLGRTSKDPNATVSAKWQRVTDFLAENKIKANFGMFGESLEGDCPVYVKWLKDHVASGLLEIWNHGYYGRFPAEKLVNGRKGENEGAPVAEMVEGFNKTQTLAKEKAGLEIVAFGPHSSHTDNATYEALAQIPQIKLVWFYGPTKGGKTDKFIVQRRTNLENPLFVPNAEYVKTEFETKCNKMDYIAIQGHPGAWDDARFEAFKKAVLYLRDQGCKFVTASEFLATREKK